MDPLRLMAVFAHPDDESMGMGPTLARYAAEGVETHLVCATRGERGWFGPPSAHPGLEELGRVRSGELDQAAQVLGIRSVNFLGYIDGDLDRADPPEAIRRIVVHLRALRPQVVVTFPPDGNYGHPDHIAISQFTSAALVCAADPAWESARGQGPHRVSKLYYMVDSEDFVSTIAPYMGDLSFSVDDQVRGEVGWKDWAITTRIETAAHARRAWRAILCHATQRPTLGPLADLDEETAAAVLAMQGTFYRAYSLVNGGRQVEADLFEGLRT